VRALIDWLFPHATWPDDVADWLADARAWLSQAAEFAVDVAVATVWCAGLVAVGCGVVWVLG
jgi:hypothetical protein